ncbi:unnamed protein product, partial [Prorocentrum cordatum]
MATRHAGRPPHQSGRTSSPPTFTSRAKLPNGVGAFGPEPRGNFAPVRGWFPFQRWSKRARVDEQRSQCPLQSTARSLWSECVPHELQKVNGPTHQRRWPTTGRHGACLSVLATLVTRRHLTHRSLPANCTMSSSPAGASSSAVSLGGGDTTHRRRGGGGGGGGGGEAAARRQPSAVGRCGAQLQARPARGRPSPEGRPWTPRRAARATA